MTDRQRQKIAVKGDAESGRAPVVKAESQGRRRRTVSMRLIVTAVTVSLTTAAVLAVGAVSERHTRQALSHEIETRLSLQARNLALMSAGALLSEYPELILHPLVKEMQSELPELALVVVVDHKGIVQGHRDARRLGQPFHYEAELEETESAASSGAGVRLLSGEEILAAAAPVQHLGGGEIGTAIVGLRHDYVNGIVAAARRQLLALVIAVTVAGIVLALVVMTRLLSPIDTLRRGLKRIGRGDLETPLRIKGRTELGRLAETINAMARDLKNAQSEMMEKERLTHEMELAREIQRSLLPAASLQAGRYHAAGMHRAAAEVGGDFYDFFTLPDGRVGIAIADVSGKGLVGCLITSMLAALLRSYRMEYDSPAELLIRVEDQLRGMLKLGQFVTMFYGILDPVANRLVYASAAHSPLLIYRCEGDRVEWQRTAGIPLGAVPGDALRQTLRDMTLDLNPGDLIVQYTDGINEAFNLEAEQFGFERMASSVRKAASAGALSVVQQLHRDVSAWTGAQLPFDDETLLVVGSDPAPAGETAGDRIAGTDRQLARRLLDRARVGTSRLELPADLRALDCIRPWLESCPCLTRLDAQRSQLLESALYEVCANIVEHGYGEDASRCLELWWLADGEAADLVSAGGSGAELSLETGYFVIRDEGKTFEPGNWSASDLGDPAVRRRGRGFGLDIISRVMNRMDYEPGGPEGNITLLRFDPRRDRLPMEESHV